MCVFGENLVYPLIQTLSSFGGSTNMHLYTEEQEWEKEKRKKKKEDIFYTSRIYESQKPSLSFRIVCRSKEALRK